MRRVTTLMTMLGTGVVVWSSCILFGLVDGLQHSLQISSDPLDVIVIRNGATNETNGGFEADKADELATIDGIARDEDGALLFAQELVNIPVVERADGTRANVIVRGVSDASPKLRSGFKIVQGRYFVVGRGECVVSKPLSRRFKGAGIGGNLKVGERESYRVVGLFTTGGSSADSEVWVARKELEQNIGREGSVSAVQLRARSKADLAKLLDTIKNNPQFRLQPKTEAVYFSEQSNTKLFLMVTGTIIAVFLTFGAMFAAANTMFAAVGSRTREIGTMRAIGFSRLDILICFLGESLLLCTLGGVLGVLAAIPLNALTFGTNNIDTFAEVTVNFRLGQTVIAVAVLMTMAMGLLGGLFPAIRAVRLEVVKALREL